MDGPDLAVACTPREPDPVLLEQLAILAAASIATPGAPWWRRLATRSGAAALVGVVTISGAAYAERAQIVPIVQSVVSSPDQGAAQPKAVVQPTPTPPASSVPRQNAVPQQNQPEGPKASPGPETSTPHGKATRAHGHHPKRGKGLGWTK